MPPMIQHEDEFYNIFCFKFHLQFKKRKYPRLSVKKVNLNKSIDSKLEFEKGKQNETNHADD